MNSPLARLVRRLGAGLALSILLYFPQHAYAQGAVTNVCHPKITADGIVASKQQRQTAGAEAQPPGIVGPSGFDWSDTPLGVVKSNDGTHYLFFGSDGSCHANCGTLSERDGSITRTVGFLDDPLGSDPPLENVLPQSVQFKNNSVVYVGGGPVSRVPAGHPGAGNLLMVYTSARWTNLVKRSGNYGFLGLAKSTNDGLTWTDLGFIITANQRFKAGASPRYNEYDSGEGNLVPDPAGKYYYIYFPDKVTKGGFDHGHDTFFSVARVPMDALLQSAFGQEETGALPSFEKYYQGEWDQPGLGGFSTSILNPQSIAGDPSVIWSEYLQRYVVIFDDTGVISYAESGDGIHWAAAQVLVKVSAERGLVLYAVPVGLGDDANVIDREFYIYYTYYPTPSPKGGGWPDAVIRRLDMRCEN
ncbi:MAG: hypothetical protein WCA13_01755 [Terriglobales bacterium]